MRTPHEDAWMAHMIRWGSDGYPVRKLSTGKWIWEDMYGCKGSPVVYPTKKAAVAAIQAYEQILIDKKAGRL